MIEVKGTYNTAKVFAGTLEPTAEEQIRRLCDMEFAARAKIRIMPDVHAGAGCTIGTTMTVTDRAVPNLVGVDIGCGMETVRIKGNKTPFDKLDKLIRAKIPVGMEVRETPHKFADQIDLHELRCRRKINLDRALRSIGTLGGGNHFIEVNVDEEGSRYLVVHSGSRHLGTEVATLYQTLGFDQLNGRDPAQIEALIRRYHEEGRAAEIESAIKALKSGNRTRIPRELAYVEGEAFEDYLHDMKLVQQFAALNRKAMVHELVRGMKWEVEDSFTTVHNYIDTERRILRKGAVSAQAGEPLLIPMNMRDGSLICVGKGNEDWNYSAPHGAGRLMSRGEARKKLTVSEFKKQMKGIYTTTVGEGTLDESPMAYKRMDEILANLGPTADIIKVIKPLYNFKAAE